MLENIGIVLLGIYIFGGMAFIFTTLVPLAQDVFLVAMVALVIIFLSALGGEEDHGLSMPDGFFDDLERLRKK